MPILDPLSPSSYALFKKGTPFTLWYEGDISLSQRPLVAIVGTRNISDEGIRNTRRLAEMLVKEGCVVVSGMAKGVDREAHESALNAGGSTIAVMGTPIDQCYPKEHKELKNRIRDHGLIISQFAPESRVHRGNFPRRNELMASMCQLTFIVEASIDSGTKHQVNAALRFGHSVGFLRNLSERKYPWVIEAIERGNGFAVTTKRDVINLLETRGLILPKAKDLAIGIESELNATSASEDGQAEFEFNTNTATAPGRIKATRLRRSKGRNVAPEASPLLNGFEGSTSESPVDGPDLS